MSIVTDVANNTKNAEIAAAAKDAALKAKMDELMANAFYHGKAQADRSLAIAGYQKGIEHGAKGMFKTLIRNSGVTPQGLGTVLGTPIDAEHVVALRTVNDDEVANTRRIDSQKAQDDVTIAKMLYNGNNGY